MAQLFKSLHKGNSGFGSRAIQIIRIAAELNSIYRPQCRQHSSFRPRVSYPTCYNLSPSFGRGYSNYSRDDAYGNFQGTRFRHPVPRFPYDN